jgi:adenine-specific DNA-methyltransferase
VPAPPLYIQEKIHPKVLIDDLQRRSEMNAKASEPQFDLFANFNGLPSEAAKTEFYQHDAHWANRMILGDSLQVMASLAEREGLRGKVQCIYLDPPYGIKFNSNFQWSTTSREVKDGNVEHITREPEQVKAFRDTWRDGIHSYLTYIRDRLSVARDLLNHSGSIFMQIGNENVHRVRALLDEVFGEANQVSTIVVWKTSSQTAFALPTTCDFILWYARSIEHLKYRQLLTPKDPNDPESSAGEYKSFWMGYGRYLTEKQAQKANATNLRRFRPTPTTSQSGS